MKHTYRVALFSGLMRVIRPLLGPPGMCVYPYYTCTEYAVDQLKNRSLFRAFFAIAWRLLCCNPIRVLYYRWRGMPAGRLTTPRDRR